MTTLTQQRQWKIGEHRIQKMSSRLEKLLAVADLIKYAEQRHENHISFSKSEAATWFPELRAKAIRQAASTLAAHERLVKYFNILANEIQL